MERFTISLDDHLAQEFDAWIAQRGYANRSEAFRDMVRAEMDRNRLAKQPGNLPRPPPQAPATLPTARCKPGSWGTAP